MSASTGTSISRAVDGRPGRLRHRRDGADVVEVAVGDQDRLDLGAGLLDLGEDPLRLLARVDDQRLVGALAADDEAVLGDRADGELANLEAHEPSPARIRARSRRRHIIMSM